MFHMHTEYYLYASILFLILCLICISFNLNSINNNVNSMFSSPMNSSGEELLLGGSDNALMRWKLNMKDLVVKEKALTSDFLLSSTVTNKGVISNDLWDSDTTTYYDQGSWGSCTAFAMKYMMHFYALANDSFTKDLISVAYLYAKSRQYLNLSLSNDSGASNAATTHIMQYSGTVTEAQYPYHALNVFTDPTTKFESTVLNTLTNKVQFFQFKFCSSASINVTNLKSTLMVKPILVGLLLFPSALTNATMISGNIPLPTKSDLKKGPVGGHAVCITGFTDTTFTFRNSWGTEVGIAGNFTIPIEYLTAQSSNGYMKYVFDCWTY